MRYILMFSVAATLISSCKKDEKHDSKSASTGDIEASVIASKDLDTDYPRVQFIKSVYVVKNSSNDSSQVKVLLSLLDKYTSKNFCDLKFKVKIDGNESITVADSSPLYLTPNIIRTDSFLYQRFDCVGALIKPFSVELSFDVKSKPKKIEIEESVAGTLQDEETASTTLHNFGRFSDDKSKFIISTSESTASPVLDPSSFPTLAHFSLYVQELVPNEENPSKVHYENREILISDTPTKTVKEDKSVEYEYKVLSAFPSNFNSLLEPLIGKKSAK